jgi:hypothetical protein
MQTLTIKRLAATALAAAAITTGIYATTSAREQQEVTNGALPADKPWYPCIVEGRPMWCKDI